MHDRIKTVERGGTKISFARTNCEFELIFSVVNLIMSENNRRQVKIPHFIFNRTPHS